MGSFVTSNTGPILVFPRIQPFGSVDFSSLGKVFSRRVTDSAKNWRLRKQNQHCLDHQSFHEFSFALEIYTGLPVLDHSDACFREKTAPIRSHKSSAGTVHP